MVGGERTQPLSPLKQPQKSAMQKRNAKIQIRAMAWLDWRPIVGSGWCCRMRELEVVV
jgi:hypothetical protein